VTKIRGNFLKNVDDRSTFHEHNMREKRKVCRSLIRKMSEVSCLEYFGADERIIFNAYPENVENRVSK
jgi:hypothetical protein